MSVTIRPATVDDAALILGFIRELAIYEKAEHEVIASEADIARNLFAHDGPARALIVDADGIHIGFAVYFYSYSTWLGRKGLYLEDLYISPAHRGHGAGKQVLRYLAQLAVSQGCGRFEWSVLDWNEPAIRFYRAIGAVPQDEWVRYRMAGENLKRFAQSED
ncbi:MAG: GNAT family N-acetyltransferase [Paludibacterium sp.]|uniref:GNAT family N-acetyltransferase n=1 Tax=Paludibacterium sp. TaxID=1917523 RepID=UPI0025D87AC1|nr:GNAT family N-acetyltransferase [Paludibacterium sp.]MBV8048968.1 GNAT family N-acetyltransferase [Paludibacterium sp.]MBV8646588.1 GNAT family N-acetyltransferase [Paludibacterium sp.]